MTRTIHHLTATASELEVETRLRCQDDGHTPDGYNPLMDATFCHCGRVRWRGFREPDRWPDRDARLTAHIKHHGLEGDS